MLGRKVLQHQRKILIAVRAGRIVSLLTICDGKPSVLFFDLEVIANVHIGATHIVLVVVVGILLAGLIVGRRWSGSRVDILWIPWGLRHLLIEAR